MLSFLKNHPFGVEAFFGSSIVLTFAIPKEDIQYLIPPCLDLDTFNDKWAFIAIAMVQTRNLRPKYFPKLLGNDFFLVGYRIFVKYINNSGKRLRGLYILKSETDKKKMEFLGNIFTHYRYSTTDIKREINADSLLISSVGSNFKVVIETNEENVSLPAHSPFINWKEARRFAGPLPYTFSYNKNSRNALIVEGVRENWIPKPIHVKYYNFSFLDQMKLKDVVLANAFIIENIPYSWKKGKLEQWKAA